jgi:hypothetical protein
MRTHAGLLLPAFVVLLLVSAAAHRCRGARPASSGSTVVGLTAAVCVGAEGRAQSGLLSCTLLET